MLRRPILLLAVILLVPVCCAEQLVRVATYNIRFLDTNIPAQRLTRLRDVVERLDAHVIGLQEIDNRAALEQIFPPADWHIIIDDDSGNNQDVALVVRKPLNVLGFDASLDADDEHFLFPGANNNSFFPNRRDVLFAEVAVPNVSETFFVMVHHAKARSDNNQPARADTDFRREGASREIIKVLEQRFDGRDFILLGDFNDNPDDRSLNILETGDPLAAAGPEETDGPFLINLAESLVAANRVSHGRNSADLVGDKVDTIDLRSRTDNNDFRGTNKNTGDILFDQILAPMRMQNRYVQGSARVFDDAVGAQGNENTRASDHLPVSAEFIFGGDNEPAPDGTRILSLLPNPTGPDAGNEQITLKNFSSASITLTGWKLRDRAGNEFSLQGSVAGNGERTITLPAGVLPLNNDGDQVSLSDENGILRHQVSYTAAQVSAGVVISFP
jgi:endonuclease/exonuclease/phosphatase family metal-dependent hydrolase